MRDEWPVCPDGSPVDVGQLANDELSMMHARRSRRGMPLLGWLNPARVWAHLTILAMMRREIDRRRRGFNPAIRETLIDGERIREHGHWNGRYWKGWRHRA